MDRKEESEELDSLAMLQQALNERKKKRAESREGGVDMADCYDECSDSASASRWLPRSLHHRIQVQANGGMKSGHLPISMPGLTFVPLYDFVNHLWRVGEKERGGGGKGLVRD